jgi:hypothetical protein
MTTTFYNKYYLNNGKNSRDNNNDKNDSTNINILKKDYTLDYTDYEKLKINEQYNKLYANTYETNKQNVASYENKKIYNLSLSQLANKASHVYITILNDFSIYFSKENKNKSMNQFGNILVKDDNLLFIGLLLLILSFLLWVIDVTK